MVAEGRIMGSLNLSRALGDLEFKTAKGLGPEAQMVTPVPEVRELELTEGDEFLVLACDGIWDVLSNQEVRVFVVFVGTWM
jgi:serine/threonine protein phosphatase PrpC